MRIVILAGGVGGSKFVSGVRVAYPNAQLTVIVNTADDLTLHGLRICPDLDTLMYTLAGAGDAVRGWGRQDETWRVRDELAAYGVPAWFALGDLDLATHLARTDLLKAGHSLAEVTDRLNRRWRPNEDGLRLVPMSNDPVETHIEVVDPTDPSGRGWLHFQEYWVREHAVPEALAVDYRGVERAAPTPGLIDAIEAADLVLVAPSNPVVSIGPILAVPGLREALQGSPAPVVGFAGILGGAPVLGMAHRLLPVIGVPVSAAAVGRHYGARRAGGVLDTWVMDFADAETADAVAAAGLRPVIADLIMKDAQATAAFVIEAVGTSA